MLKNIATIIILAFLGAILLSAYTVSETQQVVVIQFGRPIKTVKKPGLYFKIPFVQQLTYFDDRLLDYDSSAAEIITKDKKNLVVDNYSKWKIVEPLKFLTSVYNEDGAQKRLDDIIYSEMRVELGKHNLVDIVSTNRTKLMKNITERSNEKTMEYGIQVLDVRVKRTDLPKENATAIYGRMRAERGRIAREYRSQGEEESLKIKAKTNKERTIMLSEAYKREQAIRGEGDAEAIKIYAKAFGADQDFYSFLRTLDVYKSSFNSADTVVLSPDSDILRFFKGMD